MPSTTVPLADIPLADIPLTRISGESASLADFSGKVLLLVNVASQCGFTPQYQALEKIYAAYRARGFEVLGFPANDFGSQEPGSDADIQNFCTTNFGASFPMFGKISVTGEHLHPLYEALIQAQPSTELGSPDLRAELDGFLSQSGGRTNPAPGILWNFEKFLLGRDGQVLARFASDITPDDTRITQAIESAL